MIDEEKNMILKEYRFIFIYIITKFYFEIIMFFIILDSRTMRSSKKKLAFDIIMYWNDVNKVLFKPWKDLL